MAAPRPLALWPTLSAIVVAVALGSLVSGGLCAARQPLSTFEALALIVAQWLFVGWCIYGANRWRDDVPNERPARFGLCLAVATPIMVLVWIAAAQVYFALGGRL